MIQVESWDGVDIFNSISNQLFRLVSMVRFKSMYLNRLYYSFDGVDIFNSILNRFKIRLFRLVSMVRFKSMYSNRLYYSFDGVDIFNSILNRFKMRLFRQVLIICLKFTVWSVSIFSNRFQINCFGWCQ